MQEKQIELALCEAFVNTRNALCSLTYIHLLPLEHCTATGWRTWRLIRMRSEWPDVQRTRHLDVDNFVEGKKKARRISQFLRVA